MTTQEKLAKASEARLKQALDDAHYIYYNLADIKAGNQPIEKMAEIRQRLSSLNQAVHEASAYHTASKTR